VKKIKININLFVLLKSSISRLSSISMPCFYLKRSVVLSKGPTQIHFVFCLLVIKVIKSWMSFRIKCKLNLKYANKAKISNLQISENFPFLTQIYQWKMILCSKMFFVERKLNIYLTNMYRYSFFIYNQFYFYNLEKQNILPWRMPSPGPSFRRYGCHGNGS
jgi:hypothetical protein